MRRHSTHLDRHSRHHSTSQRHSIAWDMEAAWEDTSNANGCRPNECLLIEMRHVMIDILWICTTHLQPPHATYVAWKWLAYITHCHTSCLDIIVISIKTSRRSQNLQNWRNNLSADWKCMDNLILSWFFSSEIAQEPAVDIVLRPTFHLKTASWEYFDYVFWLQRSDNWFGDWFGTLTLRFSSFPFELCHVFAFGFITNLKVSFNFGCKKVKLHTTSFNFQNSLQESPWKLMATSGLWALVSWEMELQPNQHGAWIAFGATCIGVKNENSYILYQSYEIDTWKYWY